MLGPWGPNSCSVSLPYTKAQSSLPYSQNPVPESTLSEINPIQIPCFFKVYLNMGFFF